MADAEDLKAKEKKWSKGCVPDAIKEDDLLKEYMETKLELYTKYDMSDENLWELYREDFKDFKTDDFKRLGTYHQRWLRKYLRCGGVYVAPAGQGVLLTDVLHDTLTEETQHVWTNQDVADCNSDLSKGTITSVWITMAPDGNSFHDRRLLPKVEPIQFMPAYSGFPVPANSPLQNTQTPQNPQNPQNP